MKVTVVKNARLTILGGMEEWLCIFPPLAQFPEQRASSDSLSAEALGLSFLGCFWGDLEGDVFVFLCFKILCRIQTAAIFLFQTFTSAWLEGMESSNCPDKIKEETLFSISYGPDPNSNRREAKHLGVFHSNTSTVFIWYKMIMSALLRALTRWQRLRFPELTLQTFNST